MATTPEGRVKLKLKKQLDLMAGMFYFCPIGGPFSVAGIPDFVCCYKGKFIGIETKAPGRRGHANAGLSALQVRIRRLIEAAGGMYFIVDDEESLEEMIGIIV